MEYAVIIIAAVFCGIIAEAGCYAFWRACNPVAEPKRTIRYDDI